MYCTDCGLDHATTSTGCLPPRRSCPRCGSLNHDGRATALCPSPPWEQQVIITRPRVVVTPVTIIHPEIVPPVNFPR